MFGSRAIGLFVVLSATVHAADPVKLGDKVGPLSFKDIRYVARTLNDFGDKKAFVLVFVDRDCPLVQKYLPVLERLHRDREAKGLQVIAVNSGPHDTITTMAHQAVEFGCTFPFVKDIDCRVADACGVQRTPEVVVLDAHYHVRYRGRIDDQYRNGGQRKEPTRRDLLLAVEEVLAGKPVSVATTAVDGCLITRPSKNTEPVNYAEHVAPILKNHCQSCHQPNTAAPFALLTYEQAKAKGRTLAEAANEGRMPPWFAHQREGDQLQHQHLTSAQRDTLVRWVAQGMPQGDLTKAPAPLKEEKSEWRIGQPDLVLSTSKVELPKEGDIPYKYLILPHVFAEDTWVQAVQIKPSLPKAVHHANLAHFKLGESFKESNFVTGIVPNGEPMTVQPGVAYLIPKGSMLGLQVHYVTTGKPEQVSLSVGIKYARGTIDQRMRHMLFVDTRYTIPAGASAHPVAVERTVPNDIVGIGLFAHMHVRGKAMSFTAQLPDGKTESLLSIPNYNFEWQLPYRWEPGKKVIPKGTKITCTALYDNSAFNPYNPDSTKPVKDGPQTYHEMLNGFMFYVEANEKLGLAIDPKTGRVVSKPTLPKKDE